MQQPTRMIPPETFDLQAIRLRRPRLSDAEAIFEYASDPDVVRYMDWPRSLAVDPIIEAIRERAKLWDLGKEFYWVITLPTEGHAIGSVSCQQGIAILSPLKGPKMCGNC